MAKAWPFLARFDRFTSIGNTSKLTKPARGRFSAFSFTPINRCSINCTLCSLHSLLLLIDSFELFSHLIFSLSFEFRFSLFSFSMLSLELFSMVIHCLRLRYCHCKTSIETRMLILNLRLRVDVLEFVSPNMALELNMLSGRMSKSHKLKDVLTTLQ